jgi:hypothetical protein
LLEELVLEEIEIELELKEQVVLEQIIELELVSSRQLKL